MAIATFSRRPSTASGNAWCFSAWSALSSFSVASVTASKSASIATGNRVSSPSTMPTVSMSRNPSSTSREPNRPPCTS
nr:hypothetical protein [Corallococcus exiguus]